MNMKLRLKRFTVDFLTLISTASSSDGTGVLLHSTTCRSSSQLTLSIILLRFIRSWVFKTWMM
jgi:hypothetical protein